MKWLDVSWGSPKFLEPYWKSKKISIPSHLPTSYLYGSLPELQEAIKKLHNQEGNVDTKDKHVVIGNGASQVLIAILACLKKPTKAVPPHFSRFPKFADFANVPWEWKDNGNAILTLPNNPNTNFTTSIFFPGKKTIICDFSYNWKQYRQSIKLGSDIAVFSLSKATGHASTRVGWALLSDKKLAKQVTDYIEFTTGGVSIEAQHKALTVIKSQLKTKNTVFEYGNKILRKRWKIIGKTNFPFEIHNKAGMFLWIRNKNISKYLKRKKIRYSPGSEFGVGNDFARLSIGCTDKEFNDLIKRLRK